jgi:hypothetical protein
MEKPIAVIVVAGIFLAAVPFAHLSVENQNDNYLRYREKYTHNLKNPLIQRYRERSCEACKAMPNQGEENEEKKWNYSR